MRQRWPRRRRLRSRRQWRTAPSGWMRYRHARTHCPTRSPPARHPPPVASSGLRFGLPSPSNRWLAAGGGTCCQPRSYLLQACPESYRLYHRLGIVRRRDGGNTTGETLARIENQTLSLRYQRQQGRLGRLRRHAAVGGSSLDQGLGDLCGHAEMDQPFDGMVLQAAGAGGIDVYFRTAEGKMEHALDPLRHGRDRRWKERTRRDGAIQHRPAHRKAATGENAGEVPGTVGAREIKKRGARFEPRSNKRRQIGHVALRRYHIGKAHGAHRLCATVANREYRQRTQLREALMTSDRRRGIRASDQKSHEWSRTDFGVLHRFDAQQRRDQNDVTARAQRRRGPLRVRLWPCDQKPHGLSSNKEVSAGARAQFTAGVSAKLGRSLARAFAQNLECFAPVRLDDDAPEAERSLFEFGVSADRRSARAVENCKEGAFGRKRHPGIGIVDRLDQCAGSGIVRARFNADSPLPHRRDELIGIKYRRRRR